MLHGGRAQLRIVGHQGRPRGSFSAAGLSSSCLPRRLTNAAPPRALTGCHSVTKGLHANVGCDWLRGLAVGSTPFRHAVSMVPQRALQVRVASVEVVLRCRASQLPIRPRPIRGPSNCTTDRESVPSGTRTALRRPRRGAPPPNCGCFDVIANAPNCHHLLQLAGTMTARSMFAPPSIPLVDWIALSAALGRAVIELVALAGQV